MSATDESLRKQRLLVLASTYPRWADDPEPGFVHELSKRLADRFEVTVVCPHAPGAMSRETLDGVEVIRYRYAPAALETLVNDGGVVTNLRRARWKIMLVPGFVLAQMWWAWRLVRAREFGVIHAHWILPQGLIAAVAVKAKRGRRTPFVVTSHGADLFALRGRVSRWLKRYVVQRAAVNTVVSDGMRGPILALDADPETLRVEPMGVDLTRRFTPDPTVERSPDEVLFVSRLVEKKGLRHLIDAMPLVIEARPDAFLTVAGFGPELEARRAQAKQLGIMDRVRFLGAVRQSDLPALYRRAAVFVAPFVEAAGGDQDGLGLVLVEAAACGCPVVATELAATRGLGGVSHLIKVQKWSNAAELAALVINSAADCERGEADRLSLYDWRARADSYISLFEALCIQRLP